MSQASSRLIAAASWGRVALEHGATAGADCVAITIEGSLSADLDGALALAKRWSAERLPSVTPMLSALRDGERLELRRLVPIGSTLRELVQTSGPLTERQVAALFLELAQDLHVCHQRRLVVGELSPDTLFVCPPGREKTAALRIHDAGMSLIVQAAVGERLNSPVSPLLTGVAQSHDARLWRAPSARRDLQALQDAIGFALTGQWPVEADVWSSKRLTDGAPNLAAAQSADAAPPTAETWASACAAALGGGERLTVAAGGGPWELGSPLMPLAVHASTRLFDDRFETFTPLVVPGVVGDDDDEQEQQAALKLRAAMQTLDLRRLEAQRASQKKERLGLKFAIVFVTCVIAAATVYFATRKPAVLSPWSDLPQARKRLRRAPPPQPVKSVPLFTPEDRP